MNILKKTTTHKQHMHILYVCLHSRFCHFHIISGAGNQTLVLKGVVVEGMRDAEVAKGLQGLPGRAHGQDSNLSR